MKKQFAQLFGLVLTLSAAQFGRAQTSDFTYQGRLTDNGAPVNGLYDLQLTIYDSDQQGSMKAGPLLLLAVPVTNGLFTVTMVAGSDAFPGQDRWLQIYVRSNNTGSLLTLMPRQKFTAAPYAIRAANLSGTVAATQITGQVVRSVNGVQDSVILAAGPSTTLTTSGNTVTVSSSSDWKRSGNAGTLPGMDVLGTTDYTPLTIVAGGSPALRIFPGQVPSLVGGFSQNSADGTFGAAIAGGGDFGGINQVQGNYGFIGAGMGNNAGTWAAVAGGEFNAASGQYSFVGAGSQNTGSGYGSAVGGGQGNHSSGGMATVGGGDQNTASAADATIPGGHGNQATGIASLAAGTSSIAAGNYSLAMGEGTFANSEAAVALGSLTSATDFYSMAVGHRAKAIHAGSFVWADSADADFASTDFNQFSIRAAGGVRLNTDSSMFFGNQLRQMLNLWGTDYGIGVQSSAEYFRSASGFCWFKGGVHDPNPNSPGPGGTELLRLGDQGGLHLGGPVSELSLRDRDSASVYVQTPANGERWVLYSRDQVGSGRLYIWSGGDKVSVDTGGNIYATALNPGSDRNTKENFSPVDPQAVLDQVAALPVTRWNFKQDPGSTHIGPMAQDFYAAFGVGPDDKHIATVDADGVALAAIQGLNQKLKEKDAAIEALQNRLERLEEVLAAIQDKTSH